VLIYAEKKKNIPDSDNLEIVSQATFKILEYPIKRFRFVELVANNPDSADVPEMMSTSTVSDTLLSKNKGKSF
jgi:hypothetical protein